MPLFVKIRKGKTPTLSRIRLSSIKGFWPEFLVRKFGFVVNDRKMGMLLKKWKEFTDLGAKPVLKTKTRSAVSAFHFGIWRRYKLEPHFAADSNSKQEEVRKIGDEFNKILRDAVARKLARFYKTYSSSYWERQKKLVSIDLITYTSQA